ncbi:sel1 repeat family protein, partial [Staphylococcus aureus]|nr:sel1 repeat family protein [Staphylococcus aureus]
MPPLSFYLAQPPSVSPPASLFSTFFLHYLPPASPSVPSFSQFFLITRYQYGKDVAKDDKQAFAWFKAAADQGLSPAQLNVGRMYADGIGVKKDEAMARKYFEKAASNGDNRAS